MFGTKAKPKAEAQKLGMGTMPNPGNSCVIANGTHIEGKITCSEDIRIDGTVVGEVKCDKRFVMGETGRVEGEVKCIDSSIKGKIKGTISVNGLLHLLGTAMIKGKIIAKKMVVDEGAAYNGECLIGEENFK
ncbi:MAG: polymer-forming cytoskeletal protein [Bacteroidota bacterium]